MRAAIYLVGVFVSLLAGLFLAGLSGSIRVGFVASMIILLVTIYLAWERRAHGEREGRVHERNAGADAGVYSQVGYGGSYFGSNGGGGFGGGCDGGGGGSC